MAEPENGGSVTPIIGPAAEVTSSQLKRIPELPRSEIAAAESTPDQVDPAQEEARKFGLGEDRKEWKDDAERNEHTRSERFKNNFEILAIISLWVAAAALTGISLVWLAHMVLPAKWRWLSSEDLSHIQSIVTAGLLVGVIGNHFKKRLG